MKWLVWVTSKCFPRLTFQVFSPLPIPLLMKISSQIIQNSGRSKCYFWPEKLVDGRTIYWEATWEETGWWWTQPLRRFICLWAQCPAPSKFRALEGREHNLLVFEPPQHPAQSHVSPGPLNGSSEWVGKVWVETLSWLCPQGEGVGSWYKSPEKAGVDLGHMGQLEPATQGFLGSPSPPAAPVPTSLRVLALFTVITVCSLPNTSHAHQSSDSLTCLLPASLSRLAITETIQREELHLSCSLHFPSIQNSASLWMEDLVLKRNCEWINEWMAPSGPGQGLHLNLATSESSHCVQGFEVL